jgi:hypothetical protein
MLSLERRVETLEEIVLALFKAMLGKRQLTNLQMMDLKRRVELGLEMSKEKNFEDAPPEKFAGGKVIPRSESKAKRNKKQEEFYHE